MRISPSEGRKLPAMTRTRVDLPAPLSPIRPTASPGSIVRSTPFKASIAPKCLAIPLSSKRGIDGSLLFPRHALGSHTVRLYAPDSLAGLHLSVAGTDEECW